jgi:predicted molibdopterin-dependent oxidoreductase YjgC
VSETIDELTGGGRDDDDEGLFSRDVNGQLVRLDAPTEADYYKRVKMQIDGRQVEVPLAEPLKDAQGSVVLDLDGRTTPRSTTIYDAAQEAFDKRSGEEAPIPILCHQSHMNPVAVCRLCVVQIYGQKRGKRAAERKLLPACQHQVKEGMEVFTMNAPGADGDKVRQAVAVLTELLVADHLKDAPEVLYKSGSKKDLELKDQLAEFNELGKLTGWCGISKSRFAADVMTPPPKPAPSRHRPLDLTSPVFVVDHSACILCDRCWRACNDVKRNNVINRTGKGATAGIAFDLDRPMGRSSCVQCGECMVSCPTTAITFRPLYRISSESGANEMVPADEAAAAEPDAANGGFWTPTNRNR